MEIDLVELKKVVDRLFEHVIETRGVKVLRIEGNYYWNIPDDGVYNMSNKPTELNIGSLNDDWNFISSLLNDNADPVAYQFTEVSPLLRYLGQALSRDLAKFGG